MTSIRAFTLRAILSGALLTGAAPAFDAGTSQEPTGEPAAESVCLEEKLDLLGSILEGLLADDQDRVRGSAAALRRMSADERFAKRQDSEAYRLYVYAFEYNTELLSHYGEADDDDADGWPVAAFGQLTLSCVHCHRLFDGDEAHP